MCQIWFVSDFVNYHKRDVQLPPGCKDLVDVLSLQPRPRLPEPSHVFRGKLRDLARHVTRLMSSLNSFNSLLIVTKRGAVRLFYRRQEGPVELHIGLGWAQIDHVMAIRAFFTERGFVAVLDHLTQGSQIFYYDLPGVAEPTSCLVADLLRTVYLFDDDAQADFLFAVLMWRSRTGGRILSGE